MVESIDQELFSLVAKKLDSFQSELAMDISIAREERGATLRQWCKGKTLISSHDLDPFVFRTNRKSVDEELLLQIQDVVYACDQGFLTIGLVVDQLTGRFKVILL